MDTAGNLKTILTEMAVALRRAKPRLFLSGHLRTQYRGKHFIVVQGIEPNTWKWTVDLDETTSKSR